MKYLFELNRLIKFRNIQEFGLEPFLIRSAIDFNIEVAILDPNPEAPCQKLAASFEVGDLNDFDTVYNFGKKYDLITIEIE